ncbi:trypsin-like serine peptidase [Pyxidicoccus trucidator]|uniref:trypsin-like serine peptidase n=1 Tax=Pyxidicoccus trucidator TaxID=2709662 RepID=UPI0013DC352B|nr:serine protease [Pyxidicoccus trucidator]
MSLLSSTQRDVVYRRIQEQIGDQPLNTISAWMGHGVRDRLLLMPTLGQQISELIRFCDEDGLSGPVPLLLKLLDRQELLIHPEITAIVAELRRKKADIVQTDPFGQRLLMRKERIVHEDDMLPFGFLLGGQHAGRCVARVLVPRYDSGKKRALASGEPYLFMGTAWLVTPDLVLTNHHVLNARVPGEPDAPRSDLDLQASGTASEAGTVLEFDYDHTSAPVDAAKVTKLEAVDIALDFALLRLAALQPARKFLPLRAEPVENRTPVNIIQHPRGRPKMLACRNNLVTHVAVTELRYFTDTEQGSSGSPVLDDTWRVVALHRASVDVDDVEYQGRKTAWVNVGTPIGAILAYLKARHPALWDEVRQAQGLAP